ncbi:hypothetical protein GCM10022244_18040 [Streptomyces gulbargensis]|uniref:DUF397 domain-containing protein n=1 Tax=Streptomyces gulbargensis TaxID=364901 RepID=A0ABP7LTJ3_9ACTN
MSSSSLQTAYCLRGGVSVTLTPPNGSYGARIPERAARHRDGCQERGRDRVNSTLAGSPVASGELSAQEASST